MTILRIKLNKEDIGEETILAAERYRETIINKAIDKALGFKGGRMFGPFQEPTVDLLLSDDVEIISKD